MRAIRRWLTRCVPAALLAAGPLAPAHAAGPEAIIGYGPLTFGMTVEEALRAAPKARLMRCNFPNHFKNCVDYEDKPYGLTATVRARFDTDQKLDAIYVQFDQLDAAPGSQACRKTATAVLNRLRDEYGPNWLPKRVAARDSGPATGGAKASAGVAKAASSDQAKSAPPKDGGTAMGASTAWPEPPIWYGARGGKMGLVDLCAGDDSGVVYIVITPSSIPGRKAS